MKFRTKLLSQIFNFRHIILMIGDLPTEIYFFQKYWFFWTLTCNKKNFGSKNWKSGFITLCGIWCRFQKCLCFYSSIDSFWLLFFWRFKKHILQERQMYIYKHILCIIRGFWCYKCILSKDNMFLYDILGFMLYFIFYFFYKLDRFLWNFL